MTEDNQKSAEPDFTEDDDLDDDLYPGPTEGWEGIDRRASRRRYLADRRAREKRKKYWWSVIFPIIVSICCGALISWGAYVTHVTYTISANYETSFLKFIEERAQKDASVEHEIEMLKTDYTNKLGLLRSDMTSQINEIRLDMKAGMKEIRETNVRIYDLLLRVQRDNRK